MRLPHGSLVQRVLSVAALAALPLAIHAPAEARSLSAITCAANVSRVQPVSNTTMAAMHGTRCSAPTTIIVYGEVFKNGVVIASQQKTCQNATTCSFYNYVPYAPGTYYARTRGSTSDPSVPVSWATSPSNTY